MALTVTSIGSATGKAVTSVVITLPSNIPSGCCIFVAMATAGNSVLTNIADSFGQTHWVGGNGTATANGSVLLDWCWNASAMNAGNTITITPASGTFTCSAYAWYVTGISIAANPVDAAQTTSGTGTAPSMTTGALAQAAEYVVGAIGVAGPSSESFTSDSNFALQSYRAGTTGGSDITVDVDMRTVMSTSAVTYAPTLGTSEPYAGYLATFKVVDVSVNLTGAASTCAAGTMASWIAPVTGSFSRSSTATFLDVNGWLVTVGSNVLRPLYSGSSLIGALLESSSTNSIKNSTMVGAVAGSSGTLPTGWGSANDGLTRTISLVTENGISCIDIRYQGTTTGVAFDFDPGQVTDIAAAQGQTWTFSVYVKLQAGSLTNISSQTLVHQYYNSTPSFIGSGTSAFTPTGTLTRVVFTNTIVNATTAYIYPYLKFNTTAGNAVDLTLRIGAPQLEQASAVSSFIPTTSAAVTRAADSTYGLTGVAGTGAAGTDTAQVGGTLTGAASTTAPGTFTPTPKGYLIGAQSNTTTGVWSGASYTRGSVATYYNSSGVLTTASANVIRTDNYDPNTLVDTGLLVESQSTNWLIQGTTVQTSNWGSSQVTATNNATTSPDGTSNATSIVQTVTNSEHYYQQTGVTSPTSLAGQTVTFSVYVKANGVRYVGLHLFDNAAAGSAIFGVFDLTSVLSAVTNNGTASGGTANITTINNGWYRISVSGVVTTVHTSAGGYIARISHHSSFSTGAYTFTGDGTSGCYVYGAQLEFGSLSSFIPTTTAAVTRAADLQGWPATVSPTLTGVSGTGGVGTQTPSVSKTLTGVAGTGAAGAVGVNAGSNATINLSGAQSTTAAGTFGETLSQNITLTGVASTTATGTETASVSKTLTGAATSGLAGVLAKSVADTLSGAASTTAAGTFGHAISQRVNLTGAASTLAAGTFGINAYIPLSARITGASINAVAGYFSNKPTRLQIELPTTVSNTRAGVYGKTTVSSVYLAGAASVTHAGTMGVLRNILLTGASMTGQFGSMQALGFGAGLFFDDLLVSCTLPISLDTYVSLRWSDDKGATWSFPITRSLGQGGNFMTSLLWRRLGMGRDRVFEISFTAPTNTSLTGIWYEIDEAIT